MTLCDLFRLPEMKTFLNIFGRHTGMRLYRKSSLGVCHGDDLFYVFPFGMPGFPKPVKTPNDNKVSNPISIDSLFLLLWFKAFPPLGLPGCIVSKLFDHRTFYPGD